MSDLQVPDQRLLLAQRVPPEGREIGSVTDLEYLTYRDRYYRMMRHHLLDIQSKSWGGSWRSIQGYIPYSRSSTRYNQSLAVELAHTDVRSLKRFAYIPFMQMDEEDYEYRRGYGSGVVRVELTPTPKGVLRPDGHFDGDTILTVSYTPEYWLPPKKSHRDESLGVPTVEVVPPTSLAMLRESTYFADDVWEAAARKRVPWDLARGE